MAYFHPQEVVSQAGIKYRIYSDALEYAPRIYVIGGKSTAWEKGKWSVTYSSMRESENVKSFK